MNKPLACAGALRKASSFDMEGRVSSGRVTLTMGNAWAVGSTPAVAGSTVAAAVRPTAEADGRSLSEILLRRPESLP